MFSCIPKNVGRLDQFLRFGISASMIYAGFIDTSLISDDFSSMVLGGIGVILMYTVIMRSCPMYILIGWSTCGEGHGECDKDDDISD